MLAVERRKKIIEMLKEKKSVMVTELSRLFEVTEETIRRDLEKLENEGHLKRTYGGAVLNESTNIELPFNIRVGKNPEGKKAIGIKAAEFIEDGDSIILDSSSTALQVAKNIKNKQRITVITNSEKVMIELSNAPDCKVISTGGTLKTNSMSLVGHWAEKAIQNYNVDKAIISCAGASLTKGFTDSNELEAEVKKAMLKSAEKVFLVVDNTKFDKVSFTRIADFKSIDYIFTDKKLSQEWEKELEENKIKLIYA
ncbi:DeoR/GlpR family DNA-binding transcription regulator [Clostridium sp. SYSU_GA19001]|uniref:DeoR/GlpR family DNA-binding transcription regulator n=1 Tax=Clostridium caldaquaticum TaxID=2940653 RepID=UPI0020770F4D|nr:DeoR/GlpR family DNA-binding transcription regulator [Clostridium caldaquaticum]MCM8710035.1 DeoR/GlpR family DNA-binding transcription regulator [Clostridium caldaquaticum]